ncbi:hypothetical protein LJC15_05950, partial [Desulfovibrio sp. OttesenSCG-928-G11]|nr:hypothetical protein [Desulfovibrio sp. OttesenSCG-928-G11]
MLEISLTRPLRSPARLEQDRHPLWSLFCLLMAFGLALAVRLLELPFWENPAYSLNGEHLLATHDAYHWVAGAEGFEFGAGHPMSELLRLLSLVTGMTPASL